MLSRTGHWINERWPVIPLIRLVLDEEIPGGARFAYTEGSAILALFLLQAVTGLLQIFFYVPTVDHAYNSLGFLRTEVPFGWLIHNLHYWGAQVMIIVVVLHMVRVFLWGAYKKPRELTWLAGVFLLLTTMGLSFTGGPLAWDQHGYWAGEVGTSIAGTTPVVGDLVKRLLRGGEEMGQLTLSRFFAMHTMVFPLGLLALFGVHFVAFRRFGSAGPWEEEKKKGHEPFWPHQAFKDTITISVLLFLLIALSVFIPPAFSGPADVQDTTYVPKPEWNFLFLYEALKYFQGPLEPVGTVGVPTLMVSLLLLLPFIDRNPERNPFRRPVALLLGLLFLGIITVLTLMGYYSPGFAQGAVARTERTGPGEQERKKESIPSAPGVSSAGEGRVLGLFRDAGCTGCHRVEGSGGTTAPALNRGGLKNRGRAWLIEQIRNPGAHNPSTIMPSFAHLPREQVNAMISFLMGAPGEAPAPAPAASAARKTPSPLSRRAELSGGSSVPDAGGASGAAAGIIGSAGRGGALFKDFCASCHGPDGAKPVPNPGSREGTVPPLNPVRKELYSADPKVFARNIDRIIQNGSVPAGGKASLSMPAFGATHTLTQQEIANIEAYILELNGVDRAQLIRPGMRPLPFFFLVTAVYVLFILVQGGLRIKNNVPDA